METKFYNFNVACNVTLDNGMQLDVTTAFKAEGNVERCIEDVHPDRIGYYYTHVTGDVDNNSIKVMYPDEFKITSDIDNNMREYLENNMHIVKVNYITNPIEWEWDW